MSESSAHGGFCPGAGIRGVEHPPTFQDAADPLLNSFGSEQPSGSKGVLLLADGTRFEGTLFGSEEIAEGELVFTTGDVWIPGEPHRPVLRWSGSNFHLSSLGKLWGPSGHLRVLLSPS